MGIEDVVNKGKDLYEQNKDKFVEVVKSEQVEDISDKVLDGVVDFVKKIVLGVVDKIDEICESVDKVVGNEQDDEYLLRVVVICIEGIVVFLCVGGVLGDRFMVWWIYGCIEQDYVDCLGILWLGKLKGFGFLKYVVFCV